MMIVVMILLFTFISYYSSQNCSQYSYRHTLVNPYKSEIYVEIVHNDWLKYNQENNCQCGIKCLWGEGSKIDVYITMHHMHWYVTSGDGYKKQFPEQVVAYFELEPPGKVSFGADPRKAKEHIPPYDFKMTYERDSDVLVSYVESYYSPGFNRYPNDTWETKNDEYFALFAASNCEPQYRNDYVKALMSSINVTSIGKCLRNRDSSIMLPDCHSKHTNDAFGEKRCMASKFKFYLAIENSRYNDYVTEKLWQIYDLNTIPVYLGAPNVRELVPGNHSTIFADDFKGPQELADYLKKVGSSKELYNEYFKWKNEPLNPTFLYLQKHNADTIACNTCEAYSKWWREHQEMNASSRYYIKPK